MRKEDNVMGAIYRLVILLAVTSCLSACVNGDKDVRNADSPSLMTVNLDGDKGVLAYDTIETIIPVLPDNEVLAVISKVQYCNNRFYVLDSRQEQLTVFEKNGHYAGKLNRRGSGPGEYSGIADFDVTPDGKLYLLDVSQRKIHVYSADSLKPQADMSLESPGLKFAVTDSADLYFENVYLGRGQRSKLVRYDSDNGRSETILDYSLANEDKAAGKGRTHLWRSGNTVLFYDRFSPNIYSLSDSAINIMFTLKTVNLPDESQIRQLIDQSKTAPGQRNRDNSPMIRDIQDVYITPDYTSIKVNSIPPQQLFIDNVSGEIMEVTYDDRFNHCKPGAIGIAGDAFITTKYDSEKDTHNLVLYKLKRQSGNI